jgi:hypothetical protein
MLGPPGRLSKALAKHAPGASRCHPHNCREIYGETDRDLPTECGDPDGEARVPLRQLDTRREIRVVTSSRLTALCLLRVVPPLWFTDRRMLSSCSSRPRRPPITWPISWPSSVPPTAARLRPSPSSTGSAESPAPHPANLGNNLGRTSSCRPTQSSASSGCARGPGRRARKTGIAPTEQRGARPCTCHLTTAACV